MKTKETLADILAEMRTHIKAARDYPQDVDITDGDVEDWADRIEAAATTKQSSAVGNAGAMREALVRVLAAYKSGAIHTCAECYRDEWDDELGDLKASVEAALDAPARNCDRYATWKDAWDAFAAAYFGPTDPGEMEYSFGVWLFAPAKEARDA